MPSKYGDIDGKTAARLEKNALKKTKPVTVLAIGAKKFTQPKNKSNKVQFRRAQAGQAATVPLTEGIPPAATAWNYEVETMELKQYGGYYETTDIAVDFHDAPLIEDFNEANGESAGKTKEANLLGILNAGTHVIYADGATSTNTVAAEFTRNDLAMAGRILDGNHASKHTEIITGGVKQGTQPINAAYLVFVHTDAVPILRRMDAFREVAQYGSQKPIHEREIGAIDDYRILASPDLNPLLSGGGPAGTTFFSNDGTACDVYTAIVCGKDAYGTLNLAGKGVYTPVVVNAGTPGPGNPLGQTATVGWKMYDGSAIINQDWIVVIKFAVNKDPGLRP